MSDPDLDEYDGWLDAIEHEGVNLTTWEGYFVESILTQRQSGRRLSEKQAEILERIFAEKTP